MIQKVAIDARTYDMLVLHMDGPRSIPKHHEMAVISLQLVTRGFLSLDEQTELSRVTRLTENGRWQLAAALAWHADMLAGVIEKRAIASAKAKAKKEVDHAAGVFLEQLSGTVKESKS